MRDQGADTRDEIVALQHLCDRVRQAGIHINPILKEVAAISSELDRYGMGSMLSILRTCGPTADANPPDRAATATGQAGGGQTDTIGDNVRLSGRLET